MSAADSVRAGMTAVADIVRAIAPLSAVKTADQTNDTITGVNDAELSLQVLANSSYLVVCFFLYEASVTADMAVSFGLPSGARFSKLTLAPPTTYTSGLAQPVLFTGSLSLGGLGIGSSAGTLCAGTLVTGASDGTFQVKFSQITLDSGNANIMHADSQIAAFKTK